MFTQNKDQQLQVQQAAKDCKTKKIGCNERLVQGCVSTSKYQSHKATSPHHVTWPKTSLGQA
eukprot:6734380-Ditylum_brightwellii.AAC.1